MQRAPLFVRMHPSRLRPCALHVVVALLIGAAGCDSPSDPTALDPTGIAITPHAVTLRAIDDTVTLQVRFTAADGSFMEAVGYTLQLAGGESASVDANGRVRARANGAAKVIATFLSLADTAVITVRQEVDTVAVLSPVDSLWTLGPGPQLRARTRDANGYEVPDVGVVWASSDPSVLLVNQEGWVEAVSDGTAVVSATAGGRSGVHALVVEERGTVIVEVRKVGDGDDPDGVSVLVDDSSVLAEGGDPVTFGGLGTGAHLVSVAGLSSNCYGNRDRQVVEVTPGDTARVVLEIRCAGRFAYGFWLNGTVQLRYMDEKGRVVVLSPGPIVRDSYAWSRDGEWIAFAEEVDGNTDIYVVRSDGSGKRRLTNHPAVDRNPTWSPDGRYLAYLSIDNTRAGVWVMEVDGTDLREVVSLAPSNQLYGPAWSPIEDAIVYVAPDPAWPPQVWSVRSDGTDRRRITWTNQWTIGAVWSPDGSRLALTEAGGQWDLTIVDKGGGGRHVVAGSGQSSIHPAWSADGRKLAFSGHDGARYGVYTVGEDGSDGRYLTAAHWTGHSPAFANDGSYILFTGIPGNLAAVMVVNPDGTGIQVLTGPEGSGTEPRPRPR
jgi:TolB protein